MPARDRRPSDLRLIRRFQATLSHQQDDHNNINVAQHDPSEETKITPHTTKRSSRGNVNVITTQPLPERGLTMQEMRSARRSTIKEGQACEKTQDVVLETAPRGRRSHHRSSHGRKTDEKDESHERSLSPTKDLTKAERRSKTQGSTRPPSINEKKSSDTRARTSLALKKIGELSSSLNNGSTTSWAESSSTSVQQESNNDSTTTSSGALEQQTQRMKALSQMFRDSKEKLQKQAQDTSNIPTAAHLSLAVSRIH